MYLAADLQQGEIGLVYRLVGCCGLAVVHLGAVAIAAMVLLVVEATAPVHFSFGQGGRVVPVFDGVEMSECVLVDRLAQLGRQLHEVEGFAVDIPPLALRRIAFLANHDRYTWCFLLQPLPHHHEVLPDLDIQRLARKRTSGWINTNDTRRRKLLVVINERVQLQVILRIPWIHRPERRCLSIRVCTDMQVSERHARSAELANDDFNLAEDKIMLGRWWSESVPEHV